MKLTIDIPDALSAEARSVARSNGTTIRELVVEGLRDELERCKQATAPAHFSFVTVGGDGLQRRRAGTLGGTRILPTPGEN
jgi:hypothetical protein